MQFTKTHKIIISVLIIAVLLGGYILLKKKPGTYTETTGETGQIVSTTTANTTTLDTSGSAAGANVGATGNYTIEQVSDTEGVGLPQPIPDLNRKVEVYPGATVTAEAQTVSTQKILALQAQLKKNMADVKSWINLGIYQKMAGDYNGAVLSWQYAGKLSPTNYVSVGNLGNLYAYFIKDNAKAEMYYKQAIALGPTQVYLYIQFAEVYRDIFKDVNKAKAIIDQGLSKVPNDPNLLQFKASLQ